MNLTRDFNKNPDGSFKLTLCIEGDGSEQAAIRRLVSSIRDLAGASKVSGTDVFDNTVMLAMTAPRKALFCDAADLLEKMAGTDL